ncbi:MAG: TetR/AcrR family transcriptional regulator [Rhodobacter sp.]|nr:TetR/AcrR family transcriptional regulator [Paracoccaceae bacterium]MCC0075769.1 TetR/AcrR family transcriptional regulator [Rhodobacter sp.]
MSQPKTLSLEERRQKILIAARQVFEVDGTLEGGLRRIASAAGYTTGAIYKMFSGKEDIYAALLEDSLLALGRATARAAAIEADPEAALRDSSFAFIEYYQENMFEFRLGLYLFERDGVKGLGAERDRRLNALLEEALDVFRACFQRIGGPGMGAERARALSQALFAALIGVLAMRFSGRDRSLKTEWRKILDTLLVAQISLARG